MMRTRLKLDGFRLFRIPCRSDSKYNTIFNNLNLRNRPFSAIRADYVALEFICCYILINSLDPTLFSCLAELADFVVYFDYTPAGVRLEAG